MIFKNDIKTKKNERSSTIISAKDRMGQQFSGWGWVQDQVLIRWVWYTRDSTQYTCSIAKIV